MDRKEFLRACTGGLCACAAALVPAAAAEPAKEDWRFGFIKRRYAKLLTALGGRVEQPALVASLREMGDYCSSEGDEQTRKFAGNIDGFAKEIAKNGSTITRHEDGKTITLTYDPKGDCFCPFNSIAVKTPSVMCECSAGWARHTWRIILERDVKVEVKDSVLRGGKTCKFEIRPVEA